MKSFFKSLGAFLKWTLVVIAGLFVIGFFLEFLDAIVEGYEDAGKRDPSTANLSYVTKSCVELSDKFGMRTKLSDIQRAELWKNYEGKAFEWNLEVREVSSEFFGDGFSVMFKCQNSNAFHSDMIMTYPKTAKDILLQMQKGSVYKVKGLLKDYNALSGLITVPL